MNAKQVINVALVTGQNDLSARLSAATPDDILAAVMALEDQVEAGQPLKLFALRAALINLRRILRERMILHTTGSKQHGHHQRLDAGVRGELLRPPHETAGGD